MCKNAMKSTKDIDQVLDAHVLAVCIIQHDKSAREDLLVRDDVGSPVQSVTAVVDSTATFGLLMDSTKKLPF